MMSNEGAGILEKLKSAEGLIYKQLFHKTLHPLRKKIKKINLNIGAFADCASLDSTTGTHPGFHEASNQMDKKRSSCIACGLGGLASKDQAHVWQGVNVSEEQLGTTTERQPVWMDGMRSVTSPVCGLLPPASFSPRSLSLNSKM